MKALKYILFAVGIGLAAMLFFFHQHEEGEEEGSKLGTVMGRFGQEYEMTRDPLTGTIPRHRLLKAHNVAQKRRRQSVSKSGVIPVFWKERGPDNVGGRTRGLIIDANDPSGKTVWAAGVAGGLWRTNDIDASPPTWNNIDDFFSNMAITTIAQDPSNSNIMYFGTGETGFSNADAVLGMGIWQTTDGGANWNQLASTANANFSAINKIIVTNAGWVYAATSNGLFLATDINSGVWNKVLGIGASASGDRVQDFEIASDGTIYAAINSDGIYRFQSNTWTQLTTDLPASGFARIELAVAPSNSNIVYATFATTISNGRSTCLGVYVTTNGGDNWSTQTCPANLGPFCWYALIMAVDPNDSKRVWLGDVNLFISDDIASSWTQIGGVHADHHAIVYRPGNSDEIVFGNDGGVYRSTDGTSLPPTLTAKNDGYNVTQFYANALHPDSLSNYILGGTQDNGTQRFNCAGICSTDRPTGADGAFCFIDQDNPDLQITGSQNRVFNLSTDAGGTFNNLIGGNPRSLFITPADYDDDTDIFYFSDGRDTLARITGIGAGNTSSFDDLPDLGNSRISAIEVSPNTANRLFVGTETGRMVRIDNAHQAGSVTVTPLNSPFGSYISCIEVENGDDLHLIATASSYGINSIFESIDGGMNWTSVEGDLPDMPVRWIIFHPFDANQALIATELGVWSTDELNDSATEWFPTQSYGLANVRVDMLMYRPSDHLVAAATHGRGMYTTDYFGLLDKCKPSLSIGGNVASGLYMADDFIISDGTILPGRSVVYQAGNYIRLNPDFSARRGSNFLAAIQDCGEGTSSGSSFAAEMSFQKSYTEEVSQEATAIDQVRMRCYPNPALYTLSIDITMPKTAWYQVHIRNLNGQLIQALANETQTTEGLVQLRLNASRYDAGMYLVIVQTEHGAITERFVVAK